MVAESPTKPATPAQEPPSDRAPPAPSTKDDDAKSTSSVQSIPPFDRVRVKLGPGALNPSTVDPLRHEDVEAFWYDVDKYFYPITTNDVAFLRTSLNVDPYGGAFGDNALLLPDLSDVRPSHPTASSIPASSPSPSPPCIAAASAPSVVGLATPPIYHAALNSFPVTHRLVAALIDEGPGAALSFPPMRTPRPASGANSGAAAVTDGMLVLDPEPFWPGVGVTTELRPFQRALEERVILELRDVGLLPSAPASVVIPSKTAITTASRVFAGPASSTHTATQVGSADASMPSRNNAGKSVHEAPAWASGVTVLGDPLQMTMRTEQWRLRDIKCINRARRATLYNFVVGPELRAQALRREHKRYQDGVEIAYLLRMSQLWKKSKRKTKYPKLLAKMHKHYKPKPTSDRGGGVSSSKRGSDGTSGVATAAAIAKSGAWPNGRLGGARSGVISRGATGTGDRSGARPGQSVRARAANAVEAGDTSPATGLSASSLSQALGQTRGQAPSTPSRDVGPGTPAGSDNHETRTGSTTKKKMSKRQRHDLSASASHRTHRKSDSSKTKAYAQRDN